MGSTHTPAIDFGSKNIGIALMGAIGAHGTVDGEALREEFDARVACKKILK